METDSFSIYNQSEGHLSATMVEQHSEKRDSSSVYDSQVEKDVSLASCLSESLLKSISFSERNKEMQHEQTPSDLEVQKIDTIQNASGEIAQNIIDQAAPSVSKPDCLSSDRSIAGYFDIQQSEATVNAPSAAEYPATQNPDSTSVVQNRYENAAPQYSESILSSSRSDEHVFDQTPDAVLSFQSTMAEFASDETFDDVLSAQNSAELYDGQLFKTEFSSKGSNKHDAAQQFEPESGVQTTIEYEADNFNEVMTICMQRKRRVGTQYSEYALSSTSTGEQVCDESLEDELSAQSSVNLDEAQPFETEINYQSPNEHHVPQQSESESGVQSTIEYESDDFDEVMTIYMERKRKVGEPSISDELRNFNCKESEILFLPGTKTLQLDEMDEDHGQNMESVSASIYNKSEGHLSSSIVEQQAEKRESGSAYESQVEKVVSSAPPRSERLLSSNSSSSKNEEQQHEQTSSDLEQEKIDTIRDTSHETTHEFETSLSVQNITVDDDGSHSDTALGDHSTTEYVAPQQADTAVSVPAKHSLTQQPESTSLDQDIDENYTPQYSESVLSSISTGEHVFDPTLEAVLNVPSTPVERGYTDIYDDALSSTELDDEQLFEAELNSQRSNEHVFAQQSGPELSDEDSSEYEEEDFDEIVTIRIEKKRRAGKPCMLEELCNLACSEEEEEEEEESFLLSLIPGMNKMRQDEIDDVRLQIFNILRKYSDKSIVKTSSGFGNL